MPLTKFRIVPGTTTKAVFFKGDTIPLDKIDDALAEKLIGKTHVLERITPEPTPAVAVAQLAPASEPAAEEAPATSRKQRAS
jgi:hypothetical protein